MLTNKITQLFHTKSFPSSSLSLVSTAILTLAHTHTTKFTASFRFTFPIFLCVCVFSLYLSSLPLLHFLSQSFIRVILFSFLYWLILFFFSYTSMTLLELFLTVTCFFSCLSDWLLFSFNSWYHSLPVCLSICITVAFIHFLLNSLQKSTFAFFILL